MTQQQARDRLRALIAEHSLLTGGSFRLASGASSSLFFDMKKTILHPEGANLIADLMLDIIDDDGVDYVGGMAMGGVPLVAALCVKSLSRRPLNAFFVRKETKDHGTQKLIDGPFEDGAPVVLVEDVTTTGGSIMKAVNAVRDRGSSVKRVVIVVDRLEGAVDNLAAEGIALSALFTRDDFKTD